MPEIGILEIMKMLPHRYPFLMVDRVVDFKAGEYLEALKNVTINEPFFQGHFPGNPIMPGVLQGEAMAQAMGILLFLTNARTGNIEQYGLLTVNKLRLRKIVVPGDQLVINAQFVRRPRKGISAVKFKAKIFVNGKIISEAEINLKKLIGKKSAE